MKLTRKAQFVSLISTLMIAMSGTAVAQQAEQDAENDAEDLVLEEVIVVGQDYRASLRSSIATKENATQIVDAVTAEDMGRFPAQNLAEAMQGITGVSMTRDDGAGEFISIRGMAPDLTRVEINGRTVSLTAGSSNPENATTLSFFSPDMFNKVTVIKSPRAIDVEGGVGGTVQLETMRPLDVGKFVTRVSGSYEDSTVKDDPTNSYGIFSNMVFGESFGISLGVTYTDAERRTDQTQNAVGWSLVDDDDPSSGYYPERVRLQSRVGDQPRLNLNGALQWQVTDNLELWADLLYAQEDRDEVNQRLQAQFSRGNFVKGEMDDDGNYHWAYFDRVRVDAQSLDRKRDIEQYGYSLGADWFSDLWSISGNVDFSESEEDTFEVRARARENRAEVGYDARNPLFLTPVEVPGSSDLDQLLYGTPEFPSYNQLDWNLRAIGTEETAGRLDFQRELNGSFLSRVYFGTRLASREVDRKQGFVDPDDVDGFVEPGWDYNLLKGNFFFDSAEPPLITNWVRPMTELMHSPDYTRQVRNLIEYDEDRTWSITEDTMALYAMLDFDRTDSTVPVSGNFGVRYIDYEYKGQGWQTDPDNVGSFIPYTPKVDQDYWLPSFNSRLALGSLDEGRYIRFAIGRVLSRPNPEFIAPIAELNDDLDSVDVGNPNLDPYLAWQYDLAYEHYFGDTGEGLVSVGLFYKDVENFFESVRLLDQDLSPWGIDDTGEVNTYVNGGAGESFGIEASFQTPFTMFDNFLQNFGVVLNYTYVDSERTTVEGEKAPMPGTSEHSANAVLYYVKKNLDARLVYNYRDDYLLNQANQEYVEGGGRLDFALRYTFFDNLVASLDIANITEESELYYYDNLKSRLRRLQLDGRRIVVGLSYTFR